MSLEIAKKGLGYLRKCLSGDQDRKPIVAFYGGEPLLVFPRKAIVELAHTFFASVRRLQFNHQRHNNESR
jgi:sulfatase maturation enzyme AslB (radical SAM superfamily)